MLFGTLTGGTLLGQTNHPISATAKRAIDSTYNALIKKYKVVGASIAIVDSGKIVYATGYGFADRENNVAASERTIYRIGSCTKSFTSLSILQLQEKGLLSVDSSVKKYLPELTIGSAYNDVNPIYLKDMLCHVSGLPCDISNGFFCDAPPDMNWVIRELNKQVTISPRLYKRAYSNVAYGLLGEVIARKANSSYSAYVKTHIFEPLGMQASYIEHDPVLAQRYARAYVDNKAIQEPLIRDQAAGLIHSDALDMGRYLLLLTGRGKYAGQQLISEASLAEMEKNQMGNTLFSCESDWGYGLYSKNAGVVNGKDTTVVRISGHGGDTYAFHSDFAYIPQEGVGVVILTNSDKGVYVNSAYDLLKLYLKTAKKKSLLLNYKKGNKPACAVSDLKGSTEGVTGHYNMGELIITAKNSKKIKFKQGPAKIVLKQQKAKPAFYSAKARIYGIVPMKVKGVEFSFRELAGQMYLTQTDIGPNKTAFIAKKTEAKPIPENWNQQLGHYKLSGKVYPCTDCVFGNYKDMEMELSKEKGFLKLKLKTRYPKKDENTVYLELINDQLCVTGGMGRGTGETVRVLDNGKIYFDGFEFEKVK